MILKKLHLRYKQFERFYSQKITSSLLQMTIEALKYLEPLINFTSTSYCVKKPLTNKSPIKIWNITFNSSLLTLATLSKGLD